MSWLNEVADFVTASVARPETRGPLLAVTGASFALGLAISSALLSRNPHDGEIIASPLKTLVPSLSDVEKKALSLPLDVFPGARDIPSPYGSIRVYEWGPEDGPKVLLVHGITTPSLSLGGLAHALVDRGYRVMLFDLYGKVSSTVENGL
jgi:predicted alpha/beta-fold hydrolase